jgi:hypothetical protein
MYQGAISGLFAVVSFVFPFTATCEESVEPLFEIARENRTGGAPSPTSIEKAYSACLKGVDAEFAAVAPDVARRSGARKAEEEVCHRARRECVAAPSGAACKGFVVDYSE